MDNSTKICCALALIAIVLSLYSIFTREKYTAGSVYSESGDGVITVDSSGNLSVNSLVQVQENQDNISTLDGKVNAFKDIGLVDSFTVSNNSTVPTSLAVANYAASTAQGTKADNADTYLRSIFNEQYTSYNNVALNTVNVLLGQLTDNNKDENRKRLTVGVDNTLNANGGFVRISDSETCSTDWDTNINGGNWRRIRIVIYVDGTFESEDHVEWSVNYSEQDTACSFDGSNCFPFQLSHAIEVRENSSNTLFWYISCSNETETFQFPAMRLLVRFIPSGSKIQTD